MCNATFMSFLTVMCEPCSDDLAAVPNNNSIQVPVGGCDFVLTTVICKYIGQYTYNLELIRQLNFRAGRVMMIEYDAAEITRQALQMKHSSVFFEEAPNFGLFPSPPLAQCF